MNEVSVSLSDKIYDLYRKIISVLMNKLLLAFLAVFLYLCTFSIREKMQTIISVVWYTADKSAIGNRPNRLFGLLSAGHLSLTAAQTILFIIYCVTVLCASFAIFLFVKDIKDERKRIITVFAVMMSVMILFEYLKCIWWDIISLPMFISLTFLAYYLYFMLKSKVCYIAPLFAVAAQLIDCRALVVLIPVTVLVNLARSLNKDDKRIKYTNIIAFAFVIAVVMASFISVNRLDKGDPEAIDAIFTERYIESGTPAEDVDKTLYSFEFEAYRSVSSIELVSDMICNISWGKDMIFEDHIQLIVLLFVGVVMLYDRNTLFINLKKQKV